jgi:glycosyltransferase involved in cell wall biosynthesis
VRILVLTDQWSPDVVGGSARVAADSAAALAARGHEVLVLAPARRGLPGAESLGGVEVRRCLRRGPFPQTFADVAESWRASRKLGAVDVVLAHQATNAAGVVASRIDAPVASVFHASAPLEQRFLRLRLAPHRRLASYALQPALELLERVAARSVDATLVLSAFSRDLFAARHPGAADRCVLVSGGVDAATFTPLSAPQREETRRRLGVDGGGPFLLSVRRLEPRMGLEELLRAASLLAADTPAFALGIAGDGRLAGALRQLAAELGIADRVRFFGRVSDEDVRALYASADLFVLPTVAYEGFGMATVEALASGTPVVGTAVGATPEILAPLEARLLAERPDADSLAAAIRGALAQVDEGFRARCAAYARTRFDWPTVIAGWDGALARVVG